MRKCKNCKCIVKTYNGEPGQPPILGTTSNKGPSFLFGSLYIYISGSLSSAENVNSVCAAACTQQWVDLICQWWINSCTFIVNCEVHCWPILICISAYALHFINFCFGSLFWVLRMGWSTISSQNTGIAWMGGGLILAWIFLKDLSTCTEGPQKWSFITQKW